MGNWQIKQEAVKNLKEREKVRKEKIGRLFLQPVAIHFYNFSTWWRIVILSETRPFFRDNRNGTTRHYVFCFFCSNW